MTDTHATEPVIVEHRTFWQDHPVLTTVAALAFTGVTVLAVKNAFDVKYLIDTTAHHQATLDKIIGTLTEQTDLIDNLMKTE